MKRSVEKKNSESSPINQDSQSKKSSEENLKGNKTMKKKKSRKNKNKSLQDKSFGIKSIKENKTTRGMGEISISWWRAIL